MLTTTRRAVQDYFHKTLICHIGLIVKHLVRNTTFEFILNGKQCLVRIKSIPISSNHRKWIVWNKTTRHTIFFMKYVCNFSCGIFDFFIRPQADTPRLLTFIKLSLNGFAKKPPFKIDETQTFLAQNG